MNPILFVGEDNPYGADPKMALYPLPRAASGNRLREMLGLSDFDYVHKYDRCNLCVFTKWSASAARAEATRILTARQVRPGMGLTGYGLVLLGRKVTAAFSDPGGMDTPPFTVMTFSGVPAAILPHPSARNRVWNDPENYARAYQTFQELQRVIR